jgi:hypothetical protein
LVDASRGVPRLMGRLLARLEWENVWFEMDDLDHTAEKSWLEWLQRISFHSSQKSLGEAGHEPRGSGTLGVESPTVTSGLHMSYSESLAVAPFYLTKD